MASDGQPADAHDRKHLEMLRRRVKLLFGNKYRLEVAAAIARGPEQFYQRELAESLGLTDPLVGANLERFVEALLITPLGPSRGGLPKFYERNASVFWQWSVDLLASLRKEIADAGVSSPAAPPGLAPQQATQPLGRSRSSGSPVQRSARLP